MSRLRVVFLAVLVVSGATASAASAADTYVPTFDTSQYWLHANGSPFGNADAKNGSYVKWDTTKPTDANGAFYWGVNYATLAGDNHDPQYFFTSAGKYKGDIDNLAFDLYFVGPSQSTIGCDVSLSVELTVDGENVISQDYTGSAGFSFSKVDDQTNETRFVLTNIFQALKALKVAHGPDVVHDVYVNFQNFYACNEFVWRYDSTAYPANFIANIPDAEDSGYFVIDVNDPPPPLPSS